MSLPDSLPLIDEYVAKYLDVLGFEGALPVVKIVNRLSEPWLGACEWSPRDPVTTTIYLQERILVDPSTLERVVAHEVVHHVEAMTITVQELALMRLGVKRPSHGRRFEELAEQVNEAAGAGYVSSGSDESFVEASTKPYLLLIMPPGSVIRDRWGYARAVKLGPKTRPRVERTLARVPGKLVYVDDPKWIRGPKIGEGKYSFPRSDAEQAELADLYEHAPPAP
jgi:hypothetical protein